MPFYLISFLLVSFFMYHSMKQPPRVVTSLAIRHYIVTVLVSMWTSDELRGLFFSVEHPQLALDAYCVPKGFAPAWLSLTLRFASIILASIIWSRTFSLAGRKPKARRVFLVVWPIYVAVFLIESVTVIQAHDYVTSGGRFFGFYILAPALILFLAFVIDLHFRSPSSDDLFLSQKTA
jgi:hypothetical protein